MIALILAGGSGTRFWPLSRESEPKQFLPLLGERSLLAETVLRVSALIPPERILVVTGDSFVERARAEAPGVPPENVIGEPAGRNTAPCIALATALAGVRYGGDEVMVALPADHRIGEAERFLAVLAAGATFCRQERALLTLGIRPSRPETGFGYLEVAEKRAEIDGSAIHRVVRFVEKPDLAKAEEYVRSGRFLWNSGMFLWRIDAIEAALGEHVPNATGAITAFRAARPGDLGEALAEWYPRLAATSIDYAVMEKASNVFSIPVDFPWSDVGSWSALGELLAPDADGNCVIGPFVGIDTRRSIIHASGRLVATIGLEDVIIVETDRAVLVCPAARAQDVRALVERLRALGRRSVL